MDMAIRFSKFALASLIGVTAYTFVASVIGLMASVNALRDSRIDPEGEPVLGQEKKIPRGLFNARGKEIGV